MLCIGKPKACPSTKQHRSLNCTMLQGSVLCENAIFKVLKDCKWQWHWLWALVLRVQQRRQWWRVQVWEWKVQNIGRPAQCFHDSHGWEIIWITLLVFRGKWKDDVKHVSNGEILPINGNHCLAKTEHLRNVFQQCGFCKFCYQASAHKIKMLGVHQGLKDWADILNNVTKLSPQLVCNFSLGRMLRFLRWKTMRLLHPTCWAAIQRFRNKWFRKWNMGI